MSKIIGKHFFQLSLIFYFFNLACCFNFSRRSHFPEIKREYILSDRSARKQCCHFSRKELGIRASNEKFYPTFFIHTLHKNLPIGKKLHFIQKNIDLPFWFHKSKIFFKNLAQIVRVIFELIEQGGFQIKKQDIFWINFFFFYQETYQLFGNRGFSTSSDANQCHYLPDIYKLDKLCHRQARNSHVCKISFPMGILLNNEFFKHIIALRININLFVLYCE